MLLEHCLPPPQGGGVVAGGLQRAGKKNKLHPRATHRSRNGPTRTAPKQVPPRFLALHSLLAGPF